MDLDARITYDVTLRLSTDKKKILLTLSEKEFADRLRELVELQGNTVHDAMDKIKLVMIRELRRM